MKLPIELDRRIKLHPDKHEEIKKKYKRLKSIRKVAKLYDVSPYTILMIVSPEARKKALERKKGNWKFTPKYVRRTLNTLYVRSIRARKKKLMELSESAENQKIKK